MASNIFNASLNNTGNLPLYNKYGINSYPSIYFNNNNSYYSINNINLNTNGITAAYVLLGTSNYTSVFNDNNNAFNYINNFLLSNSGGISNYINIPIIQTITANLNANNNLNLNYRYNGTNINTVSSGIYNNISLNNNVTLFQNFNGNLGEFILYNQALSTSNIALLESYLACKWWGLPSYILPQTHQYSSISAPSLINYPSLLYLFDSYTSNSYCNILLNYGNQGSLLNANLYNNYINYSSQYSTNSNGLLINYKFDNTNTNYGTLGSSYNFNIYTGSISYSSTNKIKGNYSINLNNASINTTLSYVGSTNFATFTQYTIMFWYYINSFNPNDFLFSIKNDNSFILQRNQSTNDLIFKGITITNGMITDTNWKNIALVLTYSNNNMIVSIYLNSILYISNYVIKNTWLLSSSSFSSFIINNGGNINYDDFRLYNRNLSSYEIQEILSFPVSSQISYRKNNTAYLFNSFVFNNNNSYFNINYNNFYNNYINNKTFITISFNLLIYYSFTLINIFHISNLLKISFKNNTSSIYIDIYYNSYRKTYAFLNDSNSHNYLFNIALATSPVSFSLNTSLFIDYNLQSTSTVYNDLASGDYYGTVGTNFVYIGNYYNSAYASLSTSPFLIENMQIYNYNTYNSNIIIYNQYPVYNYYSRNNFPFTSI